MSEDGRYIRADWGEVDHFGRRSLSDARAPAATVQTQDSAR